MILRHRFSQPAIQIQQLDVDNTMSHMLTVPNSALTACIAGLEGKVYFKGFDFDPKLIDGTSYVEPSHEIFVFYEKPLSPLPQIPGIKFRLVSLNGLRFISREPSRILISYYDRNFGR
ncbi:hypothetical protein ACFL2H_05985 [Planctomycetota bacterium]